MVAVAGLLGVAGLIATHFISSPAQVAATTAPPAPSTITAQVERRVLTDSLVVRGAVEAAQSLPIRVQATGGEAAVAVISAVRITPGETVAPGDVLLEVSGRPVVLLRGDVPFYRDLRPGDEGNDVRQLQGALAALGYQVDVDGTFGEQTKTAVTAFYSNLGYTPLATSPDDAEQLAVAEEAVQEAELGMEDASIALADAQADLKAATADVTPSPTPGQAAQRPVRDAKRALERAVAAASLAEDSLATLRSRIGPTVPLNEVVVISAESATVRQLAATVGAEVADPALVLSTGALLVVADLQPQGVGLVRPGQPVELVSEVLGATAQGTVTVVTSTAEDVPGQPLAGDDTGSPEGNVPGAQGPRFTVTPDAALDPAWLGQDVRVTVTAASSETAVLVVPLAAVSAAADGRTAVTVVSPDGSQRRRVDVEAGLSGGGFVAVEPVAAGDLTPGALVVIGIAAAPAPEGAP